MDKEYYMTIDLNIHEAKNVIQRIHDSNDIKVTLSTTHLPSSRALLRALDFIDATTDEALDAEENAEREEFLNSNPDIVPGFNCVRT